MTESENWLARFDAGHRSLPALFWLAAILVVLGVVGVLWSLPVPEEFYRISPLLNWGSTFLMATAVYYFIISLSLAIGLLPFLVSVAAFEFWLSMSEMSSLNVSLSLFALGIAGLWLSHRRHGGLRAVVRDLQHIMLAPAWMLAVVYRWIGIPV